MIRLRHADGSYRWCEITLRNLLDEPAVGAIVANFSDVTARREAEVRLAESEANFRQLFAQNPQPMWVLRPRRRWLSWRSTRPPSTTTATSVTEFLAMTVPDVWETSDREHVGRPAPAPGRGPRPDMEPRGERRPDHRRSRWRRTISSSPDATPCSWP